MARNDAVGFFWEDHAKIKPPKKEKIKRTPPERFWEAPGYLPELVEPTEVCLFSDAELWQASIDKEKLLFDIEVYPNYCLFAFKSIDSKKVVYLEMDDRGPLWDLFDSSKLSWILQNFCLVNFNGKSYDFPVTTLAIHGHGTDAMWDATCMLIMDELQPKDVYRKYKVKKLTNIDQIDLIELTALGPGLKVCAGRLHAPKLQDLPFKAGTFLDKNQIAVLRNYCINDLDNTMILYNATIKQVELREKMGIRYGEDLRSSSDAQMAESIISSEVKRTTNRKFLARTQLPPGTFYHYQTPIFIKYYTPLMQHILKIVQNARFEISEIDGSIVMPPELATLVIEMGNCKYKIGIGGLHSQEKNIAHVANDEYFIADTDATSYYPRLILNAGLTPSNLGRDFLTVYGAVVTERVAAKKAGDGVVAECLKIVANGSFGKLGSKWSIMYAPNLMMQVTVTGQLSILMLAERLELAEIEVTSINTDGIVVICKRSKESLFKQIVQQWEKDTGFETEEIRYKATYSRDINNYIAVYEEPQKGEHFKTKGAYGKTSPKKNAINEICIDAIKQFLLNKTPPFETITACKDITRFTSMRQVSGGAVKGNQYLGKVIRWYYATGEQGEIIYAKSGNKVARTDGAKPIMDIPKEFPEDVNYEWYEDETFKMLRELKIIEDDL